MYPDTEAVILNISCYYIYYAFIRIPDIFVKFVFSWQKEKDCCTAQDT